MKIMVTGGLGFIGSNFILKLVNDQNERFKILNFDKITYAGSANNLNNLKGHQKYSFIKGDLCKKNQITKALDVFNPDVVVHFAAESHVDRSIDGPSEFINTNILGTFNLLDSLYSHFDKKFPSDFKFIHISTDEVFGSLGKEGFFTEQTSYDPSSPYSASKASSDHLVSAWNKTYNLNSQITNCSNNYGPYQFPEKLIPLIIANCIDHKPLPIYGDGLNIRDWLFVEDHCDAIVEVIRKGKSGEKYNIGGNNEITNIEIVNQICDLIDEILPSNKVGSRRELINYVKDRPGHDYRYAIDASKIQKNLKWSPKYKFEIGLMKTIEWYIKNENWWRSIQRNNYNQERLGLKK